MKEKKIPFLFRINPHLSLNFTEQKIKEETMEESVGLGKKSYGTKTDTETQSGRSLDHSVMTTV
jgi:hypothetical protein